MAIRFKLKETLDLRKNGAHGGGMVFVAFDADGRSLCYGFNHDVGRIDLGDRSSIRSARFGHRTTTRRCSESESITSIKISSNGRFLLVQTSGVIWWDDDGKYFGEVLLVDPHTLETARNIDSYSSLTGFPEPHIICTAISGDAGRVAVGWEKGEIRIFETARESTPLKLEDSNENVHTLVFGQDGDSLLAGHAGGALELWNISRRPPVKTSIKPGSGAAEPSTGNAGPDVMAAALSPDGRLAATGRADGVLHLWRITPIGEPSIAVAHHPGRIRCIASSPCGRWLLSAGSTGNVRVWSTEGLGFMGELEPIPEGGAWSMSFSPDGKHLALGLERGRCSLWDVEAP